MIRHKDLAAVHGYLCSDGYVITNPENQKHKYYYIGLRNTNLKLLRDFQKRFVNFFGITPTITKEKDRCKAQNKALFFRLTREFGSFYSHHWVLPSMNRDCLSHWLRAYFDCDGWVRVLKGKDRKIGLESVNREGIRQIQKALLQEFAIQSSISERKNRKIYALNICGKDDLEKFRDNIGFLHPQKSKKLTEAIQSYADYRWSVPQRRKDLLAFIQKKGSESKSRKETRFYSILRRNLVLLKASLQKYGIQSKVFGPWKNNWGREYFCLVIKSEEIGKIRRWRNAV